MGKNQKKGEKKARRADPLDLYTRSVQNPEADIDFINGTFKKRRRRKPWSLREDFCGTAFFATEWVKSHKRRTAFGVDLDQPTLDWGTRRFLDREPPKVRDRVKLVCANVLDVTEPKVDVICAFNFSYCVFKHPEELQAYHRVAYQGLNDDGMFFCELYGGTEAIVPIEEKRKLDGFTYHWQQASYNPITNETLCHIHFSFPDGSKLKKAFTYDWRLWTVPEVVQSLQAAGFPKVHVYWEDVDDDGEGQGEFHKTRVEENQEGWLVYIVASK